MAAPPALACKCVPPSPATVDGADVVFTGTVTARSDPSAGQPAQSSIDPITYSIAVDDELKGDVGAATQVVTPRDSASCGVDFQVGERYLVVADRPEGDGEALSTGLCQGTQALPAGEPLPEFAQGLEPPAAAGWAVPERVSGPAAGTNAPMVALSPSGTVTTVWSRSVWAIGEREQLESNRILASTRSGAAAFSVPETISGDGDVAFLGGVAAAGESHVAVWSAYRPPSALGAAIVARVWAPGQGWGPAHDLAPAVPEAGIPALMNPRVAGSSSGEALVVWGEGDRVRAAMLGTGGWDTPVTIATGAFADPPSVALGPDGTGVVAWWEIGGEGATARAAVRAPDGTWREPVALSRPLAMGRLGNPRPSPHASAGAGESLVVWSEPRWAFRGTVHAARLGPDGVRGSWHLATGWGAGSAEGGLDAAGRATVVWSTARRHDFGLRWTGQESGGRWAAPRSIASGTPACEGKLNPRLAVSPAGEAQAIWTQQHRPGEVVMAAHRQGGGPFSAARAISRAGASADALAVSDAGAVAGWNRGAPGARGRPYIEVAVRGLGRAGPAARSLLQFPAPVLSGLRVPTEIAHRTPLPIEMHLSGPARIVIGVERAVLGPGRNFSPPFRRGGRMGANRITMPTWAPGRHLPPGAYRVHVQAMTAQRTSCAVTARLIVRGTLVSRARP